MDKIFLRGLEVQAVVGIWEWERNITQKVVIDLEMASDNRAAAATDRIEDTLNYKSVAKRVISFVEQSEFQLVETMTERIAEIVVTEFAVPWARISVNKPGAIRGSKDVGICIERRTEDFDG